MTVTHPRTIQPWELGELPLHRLLNLGRKITRESLQRSVRLAVLGDSATQHYCQALGAVLKLRGWYPDLYEAEFDTIRQEVFGEETPLYRHRPQAVILFNTVQALEDRFAVAPDKGVWIDDVVAELRDTWRELQRRLSPVVIQHTFAIPLDRPYGNQTVAYEEAFAGAVGRLNSKLIEAAAAANVRLVDTEWQASYFGKRTWFDERLWCQAKQALSPTYLPHLAKAASDTILAELGVAVKCIVVDLDNTLWGGILGDDGPDKIELGQTEVGLAFSRFQRSLSYLKGRGILLAVCSRNNPDLVRSVLETHPDMGLRASDFAVIVANYSDKVTSLMSIRDRLNIGLDSIVFLDDSPFERDMVRSALPDVQVPELPSDPAGVTDALSRWCLFEGRRATTEDRNRHGYYLQEAERTELRSRFTDLGQYLTDLQMEAERLPFDSYTLPRVFQLVQRSNQFNLTTIRYSESQLRSVADDPDVSTFCVRLKDRLGDSGIINVVIARRRGTDLHVDTWIMSCRVLGRGVEQLTLSLIVDAARELGCSRLIGRYSPTEKNALVADLYPTLGFEPLAHEGEGRLFQLFVDSYRAAAGCIRLRQNRSAEAEGA